MMGFDFWVLWVSGSVFVYLVGLGAVLVCGTLLALLGGWLREP